MNVEYYIYMLNVRKYLLFSTLFFLYILTSPESKISLQNYTFSTTTSKIEYKELLFFFGNLFSKFVALGLESEINAKRYLASITR